MKCKGTDDKCEINVAGKVVRGDLQTFENNNSF
jgi:hypothetical protein